MQSCPYKFTTVLLKTSTHLVGKNWDDFNAYVTSHGARWSVRRQFVTATSDPPAYRVDLSFDPHVADQRSWWTKLVAEWQVRDQDSGSEVAAAPPPQDDDDSSDAED